MWDEISHILDSRLSNGSEVGSLTRRSRITSPKHFRVLISVRGWVNTRPIVMLEGLGKLKKCNDIIGNRTLDLPSCSVVPQLTMLPHEESYSLWSVLVMLRAWWRRVHIGYVLSASAPEFVVGHSLPYRSSCIPSQRDVRTACELFPYSSVCSATVAVSLPVFCSSVTFV
jgi:hypothetical protein